jgi:hypothetical protein
MAGRLRSKARRQSPANRLKMTLNFSSLTGCYGNRTRTAWWPGAIRRDPGVESLEGGGHAGPAKYAIAETKSRVRLSLVLT